MSLRLSARHEWVLQSEIRNMSIECDRVGGINLSQGVCDTEVPPEVCEGAKRAIDEGMNTYTRYDGIDALREAIAWKQKAFYGQDVDAEREIVVSAGATGALYCACLALLDPGDEVILFEPFYGYHLSTVIATLAVPRFVKTAAPDWRFTEASLEACVTPRTRAIVVNTPANPTGKVYSRTELDLIARFATNHDLFVFTDEIYEHFLYDGRTHVAPASLPGMAERTITISGFSKTFSITGWRIGYCICDARWAQTIGYFNDLVYVCAPAPLQAGVARGVRALGADYYRRIASEHERKRDRLCAALAGAGLSPHVPEGAYYVLADMSRVPGASSKERAMELLRRTGVAAVPGDAFFNGTGGETLARFCFAKKDDELEEACRRIERLTR
jgi:aminotransferase